VTESARISFSFFALIVAISLVDFVANVDLIFLTERRRGKQTKSSAMGLRRAELFAVVAAGGFWIGMQYLLRNQMRDPDRLRERGLISEIRSLRVLGESTDAEEQELRELRLRVQRRQQEEEARKRV
jgi:hypothetical protein